MSAAFVIAHETARGRVRLRVAGLRGDARLAERVAAQLGGLSALKSLEVRPSTGSVIATFDPASRDVVLADLRRVLSGDMGACSEAGRAEETATAPVGAADGDAEPWHARSAAEVLARLGTDPVAGLHPSDAKARLLRHGPNQLPRDAPPGWLELMLKQVSGLPVLMLTASSVVSLGTGGVADAVATLSVVFVNGVLGYVTEREAERTIHALTDTASKPVAVLRGGETRLIPAREVVPGDLLVIGPGMRLAADARLTASEMLALDESPLTGESLPVEKAHDAEVPDRAPVGERPTMLHAGTLVAEGTGMAVAVATGIRTEAARTHLLTLSRERPRAPLETELDALGERLAVASFAACVAFAGVGLMRGYPLAMMLKDALALAVAAVPEGLPMVATTTLSLGLRQMERRGILIRQMSVVESLGAIQTLCLDKTGTLTQNRITVVASRSGPEAAEGETAALAVLAEVAALNNDAEPGAGNPGERAEGASQTERAILEHALSRGLDVTALRAARPRTATVPRGPGRPWMATVHGGEGWPVLVKGSPEVLLAHADRVLGEAGPEPLTPEARSRMLAENERLAARPARVLGFAVGTTPPGADRGLPGDLVFLGLLGMEDPLRPGAAAFVRRMRAAGIEPVLVTGDQAATAGAIARALDLSGGAPLRIVDSADIGAMPREVLAALARDTHVFARVASHEKLSVVKALQSAGRVVAMTGDGVNDGPALNAADVGIAMGRSGTDLARDVANVVIRDDELETLVSAVAQGRAIYRNVRRALEFLVTTNMSEIVVAIVEALHGPGELETPMELLWINLATDVLPGLGLALADPDPDVLDRPPRPPGERIIPGRDMRRMGRDGLVIAGSALAAHFVGLARHGPGPHTRGMTFLALAQGQLLYTLVCQRSDPRDLRPDRLFENGRLDQALLASSALVAAPFFVPALGRLLGVAPLRPADTAVSLAAAAVPLVSVLARRGIQIGLEEVTAGEGPRTDNGGRPCGTSS